MKLLGAVVSLILLSPEFTGSISSAVADAKRTRWRLGETQPRMHVVLKMLYCAIRSLLSPQKLLKTQ